MSVFPDVFLLLFAITCLATHAAAAAVEVTARAALMRAQPAVDGSLDLDTVDRQDVDLELSSRCSKQDLDGKDVTPWRKLTFIHIPRTGGSAIEDCTHDEPNEEDHWGVQSSFLRQWRGQFGCTGQHVPPTVIKAFATATRPDTYYADNDTFCVVRDPYDRVVSQFGYGGKGSKMCTPGKLNKFVLEEMPRVRNDPLHDDCHFLPQVAYVRGWDQSTRTLDLRRRSCTHVLRYESLISDFNELMEGAGYPYRLSTSSRSSGNAANTQSSKDCHKLSKQDLDKHSRRLIEDVYKDDFVEFRYRLLN